MNYEIPADGVYAFSLYRPETKTRKVKVYRNDELLQTLDISARMVFCLGNLKAGMRCPCALTSPPERGRPSGWNSQCKMTTCLTMDWSCCATKSWC